MSTLIPLLEILLIGVPLLLGLVRTLPREERPRMTQLLLSAFALRLLVAVIFDSVPDTRLFHEDSNGYETYGIAIASHWWGDGPAIPFPDVADGRGGYPGFFLFCASLYYMFGRYRLIVTAFTSLCGTATIFMVYRLTGRMYKGLVAHRAALLTAYFPSMILWSAMALKDPLVILLIVLALDSALVLRSGFRVSALLVLMVSALGIWFVRFYVIYFLVIATLASILLSRGSVFVTRLYRQLIIIGIVTITFSALGLTSHMIHAAEPYGLDRISMYRHGMAATANSGFAVDADLSTPVGALSFLPIGMSVLLFGPFPWQMTSLRPLISLPEMLLWWSMLPALWRGIRFSIRREFGASIPILVFGGTLTALYSLTLGNVGAAFRQRAQIFIFLFIFVAIGGFVQRCKKHGIDPDELRQRKTA
jgi:hypothetical protein